MSNCYSFVMNGLRLNDTTIRLWDVAGRSKGGPALAAEPPKVDLETLWQQLASRDLDEADLLTRTRQRVEIGRTWSTWPLFGDIVSSLALLAEARNRPSGKTRAH
jgi:hypothetical protein